MRGDPPNIEIRELGDHDEMQASWELQVRTWGPEDAVPATFLVAIAKAGGLVGGAFDREGRLAGTIVGLAGRRGGRSIHWSHLLAVDEERRDRGIGRALKLFQRRKVLEMGLDRIQWTFDPLESRNAHLNVNRLGVVIGEYVRDLYGTGAGKKLHSTIGTDRFIATWRLESRRVEEALDGRPPVSAERIAEAPSAMETGDLPDAARVRIEIPPDIQSVKARSADEAVRWREATRRAFTHYFSQGYEVDGFYRDADSQRCFYSVARVEREP